MNTLFSERFTELLENYNGTYDNLAAELGFKSKGSITKYANGLIKNITLNTIIRISDYFNVSPIWLIGWTEDKHYKIK